MSGWSAKLRDFPKDQRAVRHKGSKGGGLGGMARDQRLGNGFEDCKINVGEMNSVLL